MYLQVVVVLITFAVLAYGLWFYLKDQFYRNWRSKHAVLHSIEELPKLEILPNNNFSKFILPICSNEVEEHFRGVFFDAKLNISIETIKEFETWHIGSQPETLETVLKNYSLNCYLAKSS